MWTTYRLSGINLEGSCGFNWFSRRMNCQLHHFCNSHSQQRSMPSPNTMTANRMPTSFIFHIVFTHGFDQSEPTDKLFPELQHENRSSRKLLNGIDRSWKSK